MVCQGPSCTKEIPPERLAKGGKYCSEACGKKAYNARRRLLKVPDKPYACHNPECSNLVEPDPLQPEKKYCCSACKEKAYTISRRKPKAPLHIFCAQGRTYKEISKDYGWGKQQTDAELAKPVDGYELFRSRNQWREEIFVYLPTFSDDIVVKPRIWNHRKQADGQPYLWVQFPEGLEWSKIKVVPISDAHRGCFAHDRQRFDEYINWIALNDNVFWFINGDLGDWAYSDSNRGKSVYEQELRPNDLRQDLTKSLAPIAHKCLWAISGTHEWRSQKYDFDPLEWICDKLGIPYFNEPVYVDILWNSYVFDFWCQHGVTSSRTKGGKMNAATDPTKWQEFTMFTIMGHVHDEMQNKVTRMCRDRVGFRLEARKQYVIICPAFMEYFGTYAARSALPPGALGAVACELYANGDYHASS